MATIEETPQTPPETVQEKQPTLIPHVHSMASDGSVIYQKGTFGYVWQNKEGKTIREGNGIVWGNTNTMSSYQAEAQGVADCISTIPDQHLQGITLWTDNFALVN